MQSWGKTKHTFTAFIEIKRVSSSQVFLINAQLIDHQQVLATFIETELLIHSWSSQDLPESHIMQWSEKL